MASKIIVYDNGGRTIDRYAVLKGNNFYTMSSNPMSILGVNQFRGNRRMALGMRLGRKVPLSKLPFDVRKAIMKR